MSKTSHTPSYRLPSILHPIVPTQTGIPDNMSIEQRCPSGVACPGCGSVNVSAVASRKPQPFRCRDCRMCFSVKTGTVLHSSNIPLNKWAIAFYLYSTNLQGRVEHEASPRPRHYPKGRVAHASPHQGDVDGGRRQVHRAGRGRRDVHRRQGTQQAQEQAIERWTWAGRQDGSGWHEGTRDGPDRQQGRRAHRRAHATGIRPGAHRDRHDSLHGRRAGLRGHAPPA